MATKGRLGYQRGFVSQVSAPAGEHALRLAKAPTHRDAQVSIALEGGALKAKKKRRSWCCYGPVGTPLDQPYNFPAFSLHLT